MKNSPEMFVRVAIQSLETALAMLIDKKPRRRSDYFFRSGRKKKPNPLKGKPLSQAHRKAISKGMKQANKERNGNG